jgi:fructose-bisphosphate aldolase class II
MGFIDASVPRVRSTSDSLMPEARPAGVPTPATLLHRGPPAPSPSSGVTALSPECGRTDTAEYQPQTPEYDGAARQPDRARSAPKVALGTVRGPTAPHPTSSITTAAAPSSAADGRYWIGTGRRRACRPYETCATRHRTVQRAATTARFFGGTMPIATPEKYKAMLDAAKAGGFAYPAINVTSSETINAALKGFADAGSDGIIQVSTGGGEFASGTSVKDKVTGAVALAEFAGVVAEKYDITVALHTDHCPKDKLDSYVRPLIAISQERVDAGRAPLFQSHMWDGSAIELTENLEIAQELIEKCASARIVLELEIGVVGGEEDGVAHEINEKLYTADGDFVRTAQAIGLGEKGVYLLAATFGNVHGVYKPGNVKLRPEVLERGQTVVAEEFGLGEGAKPFNLVFHGGSGSALEEIREALSYGVVKMNVDTDTQYAFTRPIVGHMFTNYDGVLKVDGEVGVKKAYDPRTYMKLAETGMADRVVRACEDLLSAGTSQAG